MKSDATRFTFNPRKHLIGVSQQQGRVQLDADWNEQSDIFIHRIETEAADIIGLCGGPLHQAAFHIAANLAQLSTEEQSLPQNDASSLVFTPPDFLITAGHYYVDGILCENDLITTYTGQPDLPDAPPISEAGLYLIYVDVWRRHLTALQDPGMREIALGGPDTATRTKTVWQIKHFFAGADATGNCLTAFDDYEDLIAPSSGKLGARTRKENISTDPCIVPPSAGYRGLENQLYRVEVHQGGAALDVTSGGAGTSATRVQNHNDQIKVTGGSWSAGQAVEIFSQESGSDPMNGTLAYITNFDSGSKTLTLNTNVSKITFDDLRVRSVKATYKWSRDNGAVATAIEKIDGAEITVHDLGPDTVLGFKEGQWVELTDDKLDLHGLPGQLAQIIKIDPAINRITLNYEPTPLSSHTSGVDAARHPLLRRWDGIGAVKFHPNVADNHYLDLENGVQVRFFAGTFKTGDYWTIPARTATADAQSGNIEWPQEGGEPLSLSPSGIQHHYCRVAMLHWDGSNFDVVEDCRNLFPPITELTSLFYVSGDGQEAMPNDPLPQLLQVGVFNGRWPVAGAHVSFVTQNNGRLAANLAGLPAATHELEVVTGADGIASCAWLLNSNVNTPSQQVEARLLDANGDALPPVVRFNGNLSIAAQVFYDPGTCGTLQNQRTVQQALSRLAQLSSLYQLSGDGQEIMPGETLAPLKVLVADSCGAITDQKPKVEFKIVPPGTGKVTDGVKPDDNSVVVAADASGVATCLWKPDPERPFQEVEATLIDDAPHPTVPPVRVRFNATLSLASHVAYDPTNCPNLAEAEVKTVQDAIDALCNVQTGGGCEVVVGERGQFARLDEAIEKLLQEGQTNLCICLLPGIHSLPTGLSLEATTSQIHLKIKGCGRGSRIVAGSSSKLTRLASFTLRDVELYAEAPISFDSCGDINFEDCHLIQENQTAPFITIAHARRIQFEDNVVSATLPIESNLRSPDTVFDRIAPNVSEMYRVTDRGAFERQSAEVAKNLASLSTSKRGTLVKQLQKAISEAERQTKLTADEIASYRNFAEIMNEPTVDEPRLRQRLSAIRLAALSATPGTAIVLRDAEADTRIEDNNITGVISLYGVPGNARLTENEMKLVSSGLKAGTIRFTNSLANLHVSNNILHRMAVSDEVIALLKSSTPTGGAAIDRLYRRCFFTDNLFKGGDSLFVMEHLSLTSNSFDKRPDMDAGVAVANAATYLGNYAPDDIRLFMVVGSGLNPTLNLTINIVEV
ncbi:MAG TPA: DUF6519 domain-containing protein [Pyrinomonadaceae bacterium]|nr:DUF6519 domain-containing protein [Pyrinomonadaceae bacterium]